MLLYPKKQLSQSSLNTHRKTDKKNYETIDAPGVNSYIHKTSNIFFKSLFALRSLRQVFIYHLHRGFLIIFVVPQGVLYHPRAQ